MNQRQKFEDWIGSPPFERNTSRYPETKESAWPGAYKEYEVELAWEAWQACAASMGPNL